MKKKLSPEQVNQVRTMREDGSTYIEIRKFFQDTYSLKIYDAVIAKIMRESPEPSEAAKAIAGMRQGGKKRERGSYKKHGPKPQEPEFLTPASAEATELIRKAYQLHKNNFLEIVADAIREK